MPRYRVVLTQASTEQAVVTVEAEDEEQAGEKAKENVQLEDWSSLDVDAVEVEWVVNLSNKESNGS